MRQFAGPLRRYPPDLTHPVTLEGGYFAADIAASAPVEIHVGISIAQRGTNGNCWVRVMLREPADNMLQPCAVIGFRVEPVALMRFADQIEAMLVHGGSAGLPASDSGPAQPGIIAARERIVRPYTRLFLDLRAACTAILDTMERGSARLPALPDPPLESEEWERHDPGLIVGTIAWDRARLVLNWAVDEEHPIRAARSPDYVLDLTPLKAEAQTHSHPRAWFESHALCLLSAAQNHLGDFFRDGSTDDIPFFRHLIFARGMADTAACLWIHNVLFQYDDQHRSGRTA